MKPEGTDLPDDEPGEETEADEDRTPLPPCPELADIFRAKTEDFDA